MFRAASGDFIRLGRARTRNTPAAAMKFLFFSSSPPFPTSVTMSEDDSGRMISDEIRADFDTYAGIISSHLPKSRRAEAKDVELVSNRQLCHPVYNIAVVEKTSCKHGFPRAFVQTPFGKAYSSGMVRLSCPHLVKEIDAIEKRGGVHRFNAIVQRPAFDGATTTTDELSDLEDKAREFFGPLYEKVTADTHMLRTEVSGLNDKWRELKKELFGYDNDKEFNVMRSKLGEPTALTIRDSGFIGISLTQAAPDVKCLHAHVADHLVRGDNRVGELVLELLEANGVDNHGCDKCSMQCGSTSPGDRMTSLNRLIMNKKSGNKKIGDEGGEEPEAEEWFYLPRKNQQKLRVSRERGRVQKSRERK